MKPPLAGTRCMDQSKAFCPRNFEETVSKIQQMRSKTSQWFSFLVLVRVTMVLWVVLGWNVRMGVEFACGTWTGPWKRSRAVIAWICLSIERVFIILNEFWQTVFFCFQRCCVGWVVLNWNVRTEWSLHMGLWQDLVKGLGPWSHEFVWILNEFSSFWTNFSKLCFFVFKSVVLDGFFEVET